MNKTTKPRVPPSKVPIIGGVDSKIKEATTQMLAYLDPIFINFVSDIESLGKRVVILEEIVNGALVDILAKRIESKLYLSGSGQKELPKRAKSVSSDDVMGKAHKVGEKK